MMITIEYLQWARKNLTRAAGDVLLLLALHPEGIRPGEIQRLLDFNRSTLSNALIVLKSKGCIKEIPKRRYALCRPVEEIIKG